MRHQILMAVGIAGFLSIAACHKVTPVAASPAPPVPVATVTAQPAATRGSVTRTPTANVASTRPAEVRRAATMTPQERATLNQRLAKLEDALFDYDQATIRNDAATVLKDDVDVIRGILANYPNQKLIIEGSTDERGSAEYNLALGDKRASSADQFLTTMGIPQTQLTIISYGKERPVCTDSNENCWQKNRRAHITAAP